MKAITLSLFLIILSFSSLVKGQTITSKTPCDTGLVVIKKRISFIDSQIVKRNRQIIVLAKVPGKKIPVRVIHDKWPDDIDESYNVLKDNAGSVILIAEMPNNESGDWYIEYRHYFDNAGNTIAFERTTNVFDSNVKGGVIYETRINYYSPDFKLKYKEYTLTDKAGKKVKNNGRVDIYRYPYHIYKNINDCLKAYNIPDIK